MSHTVVEDLAGRRPGSLSHWRWQAQRPCRAAAGRHSLRLADSDVAAGAGSGWACPVMQSLQFKVQVNFKARLRRRGRGGPEGVGTVGPWSVNFHARFRRRGPEGAGRPGPGSRSDRVRQSRRRVTVTGPGRRLRLPQPRSLWPGSLSCGASETQTRQCGPGVGTGSWGMPRAGNLP